MRTLRRLAIAALLVAGMLVGATAEPASAAITTAVDGTKIAVTATGAATVTFACDAAASVVLVSGSPTSPTLPCSSLTLVNVTGDSGPQVIDGSGLDDPAFAAQPFIGVSSGTGDDVVTGTRQADSLTGRLVIVGADGAVDSNVSADTVRVVGTAGDDTLTVVDAFGFPPFTPNTIPAVSWSAGGPVVTHRLFARFIELRGGAGDDTLTTADEVRSTVDRFSADGGPGNDTIDANALSGHALAGGPGRNTLIGSARSDTFVTSSQEDTIDGAGGTDNIEDRGGPRSGGRTYATQPEPYHYQLFLDGNVGVVRVRPTLAGGPAARFTTSLARPGQQVLSPVNELALVQDATDGPTDSSLFDVVATPGLSVRATGRRGSQDLADITIPSGTWSRSDEDEATIVVPNDPSFRAITAVWMDEVSVHGPWADPDESFVHRSVRDLLNTFIDGTGRAQRTAAIKDGTLTRSGFVDEIMTDDVYRQFDVERAFLTYLHRGTDVSGRAYWIKAIGNGRALWRFRAQLLGSNEYFAKAGGTNAAFLTKAYTDVLGRAPDPSGQAYWANKLDHGAERGMVALQFINAAETRRRLVDDQYLRFLDRLPTTDEQSAGVALLLDATGEQQLVRSLAVGAEYYERT